MTVTLDKSIVLRQWSVHHNTWQGCKRCQIGKLASRHVLARGTLPCEVLFVGEAPGKSEDVCGEPFIGRAGKLLDHWIASSGLQLPYAVTNIVACRPTDCKGGDNRKPTPQEVENCRPRLVEFVEKTAQPKAVVLLGATARDSFPENWDLPTCEVWHPAYVLKLGGKDSTEDRMTVAKLKKFFGEGSL